MFTLDIKSTIKEDDILEALKTLSDEKRAEFAIRLGEGGDCGYELILLSKLITFISEIYPSNNIEDAEMTNISTRLLDVKKYIDEII